MSRITLPYATLDVFTNTALLGNQLGVVLLDGNTSKSLGDDHKLAITREFNYSESVFIHPFDDSSASRRVDIWTPKGELPFAGHPTIGAINYIVNNLSPEKDSSAGECRLQLKAGLVTGRLDRATGYADAEIPHNVHVNGVELGWDRVVVDQPALATGAVDPALLRKTHRAVAIVKGLTFALIDLTLQPDLLSKVDIANNYVARQSDLDENWDVGMVCSLFFVRKPDLGDGIVRVNQRNIAIGLEDPATGSASAALGAFLALQEGKPRTYRFEHEQGTQMGRSSVIGCEVTLDQSGTGIEKIVLAGQARQVMKGELTF